MLPASSGEQGHLYKPAPLLPICELESAATHSGLPSADFHLQTSIIALGPHIWLPSEYMISQCGHLKVRHRIVILSYT